MTEIQLDLVKTARLNAEEIEKGHMSECTGQEAALLRDLAAALEALKAENDSLKKETLCDHLAKVKRGDVLRNEIKSLQARAEEAQAENDLLREAAGFSLGWRPTDPEHPAFHDTQFYGQVRLAWLLSDREGQDWEKVLAKYRDSRAALKDTAP